MFNNKHLVDVIDLEECNEMKMNQVLPLEIQSKLCIALVNCKKLDFALPLIATFLEANVEDFGDIYLDVAEALMENQRHEPALPLLEMVR